MKPCRLCTVTLTAGLLGTALITGCVVETGSSRDSSAYATPGNTKTNPGSLIGMRAGSLDPEMARLGFRNVGGYKDDGASFTTWWNEGSRQCLSVETRQGKIANAETVVEGNCL